MEYSRAQLNKAGDALINGDPFARLVALEKISRWRECHLPVLREFNEAILSYFDSHRIKFELSSMRIKRMSSIEHKLKCGEHKEGGRMCLGGLQDIGGIRFVFGSIGELDQVVTLLQNFCPENFEASERNANYNYVENPKCSGYRSVHFVYKYHSENKRLDGLSIELQVRTKLQHAWAMAVETASLISHTSLKSDINDDNRWREFFKLVSAIFALREGKKVPPCYENYSQEKYCSEYDTFVSKDKFLDQLMALRVTVNSDIGDIHDGLCVLTINFEQKIVHYTAFTKQEEAKAVDTFNKIEAGIKEDEAALMVAIDKMQELHEAYPSYFLDTAYFIKSLDAFNKQCLIVNRR